MLKQALNYFDIVVGLVGTLSLSAIPTLGDLGGGIFGLTQIVWFVGLRIPLL